MRWNIDEMIAPFVGVVNDFLSNYWLQVFSKLSYAIYLTQFAVFFYNVGTTRFSSEFQPLRAVSRAGKIRKLCFIKLETFIFSSKCVFLIIVFH